MRNIVRILATVSVLVVVSACGSTSGDDGAASSSQSSTTTDETAESSGSEVASVSLRRTGGLKPVTIDRTFSADAAPPEGYDQADVDRVLAAATAFTDADVEVTDLPKNTCCDRYTYEITISYADGSSTTFSTIDGLQQPRLFAQLVRAVS